MGSTYQPCMKRKYRIIPGSERSRPLLRHKAACLRRFKRAGIRLPKRVPIYWTKHPFGRAYYCPKEATPFFIAIPVFIKGWLEIRHPDAKAYLDYYITHELCHIADNYNTRKAMSHGPTFHRILTKVCPKRYWLFEASYQPQFKRRLRDWGLKIPANAFIKPFSEDD